MAELPTTLPSCGKTVHNLKRQVIGSPCSRHFISNDIDNAPRSQWGPRKPFHPTYGHTRGSWLQWQLPSTKATELKSHDDIH